MAPNVAQIDTATSADAPDQVSTAWCWLLDGTTHDGAELRLRRERDRRVTYGCDHLRSVHTVGVQVVTSWMVLCRHVAVQSLHWGYTCIYEVWSVRLGVLLDDILVVAST